MSTRGHVRRSLGLAAVLAMGATGCASGDAGGPGTAVGSSVTSLRPGWGESSTGTPATAGSRSAGAPSPAPLSPATPLSPGTTRPPETTRPPPTPATPPATSPPATTPPATTKPPTTTRPPSPGTSLPAAWRGIDLERIPTGRAVVALTFDAGSSDAGVASILATLSRYGVRATFFTTGEFARRYPSRIRAIAAAGHPVGNHSNTHLSYPDLTDAQIRADLAAVEAVVTPLTGRPARPLFRFPYGARTAADIRAVNAAGYLPVRWTVDSLGWKGTSGGLSTAAVTNRVLSTALPDRSC